MWYSPQFTATLHNQRIYGPWSMTTMVTSIRGSSGQNMGLRMAKSKSGVYNILSSG